MGLNPIQTVACEQFSYLDSILVPLSRNESFGLIWYNYANLNNTFLSCDPETLYKCFSRNNKENFITAILYSEK